VKGRDSKSVIRKLSTNRHGKRLAFWNWSGIGTERQKKKKKKKLSRSAGNVQTDQKGSNKKVRPRQKALVRGGDARIAGAIFH